MSLKMLCFSAQTLQPIGRTVQLRIAALIVKNPNAYCLPFLDALASFLFRGDAQSAQRVY